MTHFSGRHIMLDTETLSLGMSAAIVQIGATAFYPEEGNVSQTERLNIHIRLGSSLSSGATLDPETLMWWMEQSDDARRVFVEGQKTALDIIPALMELTSFIQRPNGRRGLGSKAEEPDGVWSHGAAFDLALVGDAYLRHQIKCPWSYKRSFDTRTVFSAAATAGWGYRGSKWEPQTIPHEAVSDAVEQSYDLLAAFNKLGWGPEVQPFDVEVGLPTAEQLHPQ